MTPSSSKSGGAEVGEHAAALKANPAAQAVQSFVVGPLHAAQDAAQAAHTRSTLAVHAALSNWPAGHTPEQDVHTVSDAPEHPPLWN